MSDWKTDRPLNTDIPENDLVKEFKEHPERFSIMMPDEIKKQVEDAAEKTIPSHFAYSDKEVKNDRVLFIDGAQFMWELMSKREAELIVYKNKVIGAQGREIDQLRAAYSELIVFVEHCLNMQHFQAGGSTQGWAKELLAKHRNTQEGE